MERLAPLFSSPNVQNHFSCCRVARSDAAISHERNAHLPATSRASFISGVVVRRYIESWCILSLHCIGRFGGFFCSIDLPLPFLSCSVDTITTMTATLSPSVRIWATLGAQSRLRVCSLSNTSIRAILHSSPSSEISARVILVSTLNILTRVHRRQTRWQAFCASTQIMMSRLLT